MSFIEPLALRTWLVQVFAGDLTYFAVFALLAITSLAGFFRMSMLSLGIMLGIFILMFLEFIPPSLPLFITIIGGLLIGYWVSKIVK